MKSAPLISIGMPVYNGERCLARALDSVLNQTYENLEIVISDNASTDKTADICLGYAARDPRIRYHRNATNIGVYANFRQAFKLSTGEYFTWACADDRRPPLALQACLEALEKHPDAVMVHGPILYEADRSARLVELVNEVDLSVEDVAGRVGSFTQTLRLNEIMYGLYRRSALGKIVFPGKYGSDYLVALQMCLLGPLVSVKSPILFYHIREPVNDNPMYHDVPLTFTNLMMDCGLRRWKCWKVLIMGTYCLLRISDIPLRDRLRAVRAHVLSFLARYRAKLGRELLFQLFAPISWLSSLVWRLARNWPFSFRIASRLKAILIRA